MPRITPFDCPADAARHDCAGCRDRAACIAETRARLQDQDRPHTRPTVTEEPIPRPIAPIIDGDTGQRIQYLRQLVQSKTRPEEHIRLQNQIRHDIQDSVYPHRFSLRRLK